LGERELKGRTYIRDCYQNRSKIKEGSPKEADYHKKHRDELDSFKAAM
jgi:hypothetical protein